MAEKRYPLPDTLRGLILMSMILYHFAWDLVYLWGVEWTWFRGASGRLWQQSIAWGFVLLSGFCRSFGRTKWKRGLAVFGCGALITLVTLLILPAERIIFGALTFLGTAMLVMIPLDKLLRKCNSTAGVCVSGCLFVLLENMKNGYLGIGSCQLVALPKAWYANMLTAFFGLPPDTFFSKDYFPFLPWIFLFCAGYFLHKLAAERNWLPYLAMGRCRPLEFLGRHSLVIYMVHQPILYGLCCFLCS